MKRPTVVSSLLLIFCTSAKCVPATESVTDSSIAPLQNFERVVSGVQTTDALRTECCERGKCIRNGETAKTECECPPGQGWYVKKRLRYTVNECRDCECGGNQHNCTFAPHLPSSINKKCKCSAGYGDREGVCVDCGCGGPRFNCTFSCIVGCSKNCVCGHGYEQKNGRCEATDPCFERPCKNGATCVRNRSGGYNCSCSDGYEGKNCELPTDMCLKWNPCRNGGTCYHIRSLGLTCVCPPTHTGDACETKIDPCQRTPCKNGGTCITYEHTRYLCLCPATHTGHTCEKVQTTVCVPNPCKNGGNCSLLNDGDYLCACPKWYTGKNCDQDKWCVEGPGRFLCKSGTCSFDHQQEQGYCRCTQNRDLSPAEAMLLRFGPR